MKKLTTILAILLLGSFLVVGSAMANAIPGLDPIFGGSWTTAEYWTPTGGTVTFTLEYEEAWYESDFGYYTVDSTGGIQRVQIFSYNEEPVTTYSPNSLDNIFGFYYGVHTNGKNDGPVDYYFYTDASLNYPDTDVEHIAVAYNPAKSTAWIYLEDLISENPPDWDWSSGGDDMRIEVSGVRPVPEPATMLLLGTGLIGLAGVGRKKLFKK